MKPRPTQRFQGVMVRRCAALVVITAISGAFANSALAQACNSVSGSPWSTCPTWTGPSWAPASYSQAGEECFSLRRLRLDLLGVPFDQHKDMPLLADLITIDAAQGRIR